MALASQSHICVRLSFSAEFSRKTGYPLFRIPLQANASTFQATDPWCRDSGQDLRKCPILRGNLRAAQLKSAAQMEAALTFFNPLTNAGRFPPKLLDFGDKEFSGAVPAYYFRRKQAPP